MTINVEDGLHYITTSSKTGTADTPTHTIVVVGSDLNGEETLNSSTITGELMNRIGVLLFEWDNNFQTTLEQRQTIWNKSR
jgi:hypothetical protein